MCPLFQTVSKELQSTYDAICRENEELARALQSMGGDEASLREQLAFARATIAQQQLQLDANQDRVRHPPMFLIPGVLRCQINRD